MLGNGGKLVNKLSEQLRKRRPLGNGGKLVSKFRSQDKNARLAGRLGNTVKSFPLHVKVLNVFGSKGKLLIAVLKFQSRVIMLLGMIGKTVKLLQLLIVAFVTELGIVGMAVT